MQSCLDRPMKAKGRSLFAAPQVEMLSDLDFVNRRKPGKVKTNSTTRKQRNHLRVKHYSHGFCLQDSGDILVISEIKVHITLTPSISGCQQKMVLHCYPCPH